MFSIKELQEIQSFLDKKSRNIIIIPHKNPDGDAIGSTLGLSLTLKKLGHRAEVVSPNNFPKFLKFLPRCKEVFVSDFNPEGAEMKIKNAELIFLLDFNEISRTDNLATLLENTGATKILIDHHQHPEDYDFVYSDTEMPATCEMVYHFIKAMGWEDKMDSEIATCLYTGILTDTGNFRFPSVRPSTLEVGAELMRYGAQPYKIQDQIFDNATESRLKLLSVFLSNMQLFPEYRTALFTISRKELEENGFEKGDTDGFVNYGLTLKNYVFSVFMAEDTQNDFVKISLRSKGDFDVSEFSRENFMGGGHINASGGKSEETLKETVNKFVNLLPKYADKLQNTEL